jgi:ADP-ribosylglycohydrolase
MMIGAIAGDMIGSVYEGKSAWLRLRTPDFEPLFNPRSCFTDDTVLTVAVAESILHGSDLTAVFKDYARRYPGAGYGGRFAEWAASDDPEPYGSWGNGSAMRVSPVGFAYDMLDEVMLRAGWTAEVTHNHPEAVAGAKAAAGAVYLARTGSSKSEIAEFVQRKFGYDLSASLDEIRPAFRFDVSCRGTVPPAIRAFLESTDYENAVRLAVSLGGDADTIACITGGIAEAFYGVPEEIRRQAMERLDEPMRGVVEAFEARFPRKRPPQPAEERL